jgi:hypothetical protein
MNKITVSLLFLLSINCKAFCQHLILEDGMYFKNPKPDDGIWIEKTNKSDTSRYKYSKNNLSYRVGRTFIYDYYFTNVTKKKRKFLLTKKQVSKENPLNLSNYQNITDTTIDKIMLEVTDAKETYSACSNDSTCTQTVITYSYLTKCKSTSDSACQCFKSKNADDTYYCSHNSVATGVYDNKKNIWLHPPRQYTFKILQFNPFPFYQLDESVKHRAWNLEIGGSYLDNRWVNSKDKIWMRYDYKRQNDEIIKTVFGSLKCKVTYALGKSQSGNLNIKTTLKSYFHYAYGFIRLEYRNIDGSKIIIHLVEMRN